MRKYGIFLAYPPTIDLRGEGLGRHLAYLLKGAAESEGTRLVVACPSWMIEALDALCEEEEVSRDSFDLLTLRSLPISLRIQSAASTVIDAYVRAHRERRGRPRRRRLQPGRIWVPIERFFVSTRNLLAFVMAVALLSPLLLAGAVLAGTLGATTARLQSAATHVLRRARSKVSGGSLRRRLAMLVRDPAAEAWGRRLYRTLETAEADALVDLINRRDDVVAWYCPTAFWPQFNEVRRPRLICVPDVVLSRLPVSFAESTGKLGLEVYQRMGTVIRNARHLVTYSEDVKWQTLVREFDRDPASVHVIRHGSNDLAPQIRIAGTPAPEVASEEFCRVLLADALMRATNLDYTASFQNRDVRFIFCPNQARPNKNMLTLVQAYDELLRGKGLTHKLILTGDAMAIPAVREFVTQRGLMNDVLCLRGLTVQQLAACYRLADVAVNPSLFEGGCPFTLTEALSVGTPAVMARIAVTEEVIVDTALRDAMLFDPYDWRDMAARIAWGIDNRARLYEMQRSACAPLLERSWAAVSREYLALLERVALSHDDDENERAAEVPAARAAAQPGRRLLREKVE
jgi:glycosyltransferase involved in cell wall biosynthesis